jgi:hypothetical protein
MHGFPPSSLLMEAVQRLHSKALEQKQAAEDLVVQVAANLPAESLLKVITRLCDLAAFKTSSREPTKPDNSPEALEQSILQWLEAGPLWSTDLLKLSAVNYPDVRPGNVPSYLVYLHQVGVIDVIGVRRGGLLYALRSQRPTINPAVISTVPPESLKGPVEIPELTNTNLEEHLELSAGSIDSSEPDVEPKAEPEAEVSIELVSPVPHIRTKQSLQWRLLQAFDDLQAHTREQLVSLLNEPINRIYGGVNTLRRKRLLDKVGRGWWLLSVPGQKTIERLTSSEVTKSTKPCDPFELLIHSVSEAVGRYPEGVTPTDLSVALGKPKTLVYRALLAARDRRLVKTHYGRWAPFLPYDLDPPIWENSTCFNILNTLLKATEPLTSRQIAGGKDTSIQSTVSSLKCRGLLDVVNLDWKDPKDTPLYTLSAAGVNYMQAVYAYKSKNQ